MGLKKMVIKHSYETVEIEIEQAMQQITFS